MYYYRLQINWVSLTKKNINCIVDAMILAKKCGIKADIIATATTSV
jgi:hypothetical protein